MYPLSFFSIIIGNIIQLNHDANLRQDSYWQDHHARSRELRLYRQCQAKDSR
ncbi:hypothetical protein BC941DRAFT_440680 [Chlamydoabsidia padenii]|nr:hypothetical protein BC941DRAFT_440680 [Chlamydoabsidia padenii]